MAHFAEIDLNNKVLRVVTACNQDIANNGGEQSEQAAEHFKTLTPLSENGVKWIQTSYNNNFRKKFAGKGDTYDLIKNMFITSQPFISWTLNSEGDWIAPITRPTITVDQNNIELLIFWNEIEQKWYAKDVNNTTFIWNSSTLNWLSV
jgi:hypothetical protein